MRFKILAMAGVFVAGLTVGTLPATAQAALSQDAIAKKIAEAYPVQVLNVKPARDGDRVVYAVTMMRKAGEGAGSTAFQVVRMLVDPMTGDPLPAFTHLTQGYATSGAESHGAKYDGGAEMRRMTIRNNSRN